LGSDASDEVLAAVPPETEAAIPLRHIVRLVSLRDVRPAKLALDEAGLAAQPFDGIPAVITSRRDSDGPEHIATILARSGLRLESAIPVWEDAAIPVSSLESSIIRSAISTPA